MADMVIRPGESLTVHVCGDNVPPNLTEDCGEVTLTYEHFKRLTHSNPAGSKVLILTCGLPRSGKTTWAQSTGYPIVCPDAIRLSLHGQTYVATAEPTVWATARLMVASLFLSGHDVVVLDACNTSWKRREEWIDGRWETRLQEFLTPKEECIRRAHETGREDIIPIIERMAREYQSVDGAM